MTTEHQQSSDRHRCLARHRRRRRRAAGQRRLHRRGQLCRQRRLGRGAGRARSRRPAAAPWQPRPTSRTSPPCARMFDSAETAFGGVDVLVNNAGIMNAGDHRR